MATHRAIREGMEMIKFALTKATARSTWFVGLSGILALFVFGCGSERTPALFQETSTSETSLPTIIQPMSLGVQQHLYPPDTYYHERFGSIMALENDTAVVNCWHSSIEGTGGYSRVYARNGNMWTFQYQLEPSNSGSHIFGNSVALSGDTIAVGADYESATYQQEGAVYVFVRNGNTWSEQQRLPNPHPNQNTYCGDKVVLAGDTLVMSCFASQPQDPLAFVFVRNGATWSLVQEISPPAGYVTSGFGSSLALSGNTLLIGSNGDDVGAHAGAGSVFEYAFDGTNWVVQDRIVANPGGEHEFMGGSMALSGDTFITRASVLKSDGISAGGAYIFARNGTTWTQQAQIVPADGVAGQSFGSHVAIDGDTAAIGINSSPQLLEFPNYGNPNPGVYLYSRNGASWSLRRKLLPDDNFSGNSLGHGLALSGTTLFVGAPEGTKPGKSMTGSVYIFGLEPGAPNGTSCTTANECESGSCVDGFCCDVACGNGALDDCQVCSSALGATENGTCTIRPSATICRASAGICDNEESCDGISPLCPSDGKMSASTLCRASGGICDIEESCDGVNDECPFDEKEAKNTPCRAPAGICDGAEVCDGLSAECPTDAKKPNTYICRPAQSECDVGEFCNGSSDECPADQHDPDATPCVNGTCQDGTCINESNGSSSTGGSDSLPAGNPEFGCNCSLQDAGMSSSGATILLGNLALMLFRRRRSRNDSK